MAFFNTTDTNDTEKDVKEATFQGRITVIEYNLAMALKLEASDHAGAVAEIKRLTKTLPAGVTSMDINSTIWTCCSKVLEGESLES